MYIVALNRMKVNNYGFFEPESRVNLSLNNRQATVKELTVGLKNALKNNTIVGINFEFDKEKGTVSIKEKEEPEFKPANQPKGSEFKPANQPVVEKEEKEEEIVEEEKEEEVVEEKPKAKTRKK